jgi:hypothetical protein
LKEQGFVERFREAVTKAQKTPFLCGDNNRGWKATFDWLVYNDCNVNRVLEGMYDGGGSGKPQVPDSFDKVETKIKSLVLKEYGHGEEAEEGQNKD